MKPRTSLLDINLKEVWQYRDLMVLFVKRDFVAKYKQTVLGPVWHFIQPILTTLISFMLFNVVANIPTDGMDSILFQMSGIIIWNYFSTCLTNCSNVFVTNASIFGKVYFPRLVMPLSIVISNIVQFGIQLLLLFCTMIFIGIYKGEQIYIGWAWLMIPVYVFIMAITGLGLGIIFSSLTTKYRDLSVLLAFGIQLLMYATAVNYPLSFIAKKSHKLYNIIKLNPIASLVDGFRNAVLKGNVDFHSLVYPVIFMTVTFFIGMILFNKVEKTFMDTV
ncbi:MAG TPA: ABC transporter permease [Ferruginibacter sp.]|nr:ABC transporter permease [Ferruginibacter sp.]